MHLLKKDVALIPIIILPILETQQLRKRGEGIAAQVSNSFELLEFVRMARLCPIRDIDHALAKSEPIGLLVTNQNSSLSESASTEKFGSNSR